MSFNPTDPVLVGLSTKADHFHRVFDNTLALSTGYSNIASLSAFDLIVCVSANQLGRVPNSTTGKFLTAVTGGVPVWDTTVDGIILIAGTKLTTASGNDVNIDGPTGRSINLKIANVTKQAVNSSGVLESSGISMNASAEITSAAGNDLVINIPSARSLLGKVAGSTKLTLDSTGRLTLVDGWTVGAAKNYLNDTSNADMTAGITLNQGAADDQILALKSSDIDHGMSAIVEVDTYGDLAKQDGDLGGLRVRGFSETTTAVNVIACGTTGSSTRSTIGRSYAEVDTYLRNSTTVTQPSSGQNIFGIRSGGVTRFLFDADGNAYADVSWATFDSHDDVALLNELTLALQKPDDPYRGKLEAYFGDSLNRMLSRDQMQKLGLVTFNEGGHHFLNTTRLAMLHTGAIRQLGDQVKRLTSALLNANLVSPAQLEPTC